MPFAFLGVAVAQDFQAQFEAQQQNWNLSPREAIALQKVLAQKVRLCALKRKPKLIAGVDVSFNRFSSIVHAGFVVLDAKSLGIVERAGATLEVQFPYISGLLSFREIPPLLLAWRKLSHKPDLIIADGQGIAHPRRLGIASHLGLLLKTPSLGCGKSRLVGTYEEPGPEKGEQSVLWDLGEQVGVVLRNKKQVNPLFVSPGHLIDFAGAVHWVEETSLGYRLPEPTRQAHLFVNEIRIKANQETRDRHR